MTPIRLPVAALVLSFVVAPASAQELGVEANVERPLPRAGGADPTASTTAVEVRDRPHALDTVEELVLEAPGALPRLTGAYGHPATLSLRGADAQHTEVLLGALPLTTADGAAFDLSLLPPWLFGRVEITRGGTPTWLGVGGLAGVVRLVPDDTPGRRLEASLGAGSFGLWQGRVGARVAESDGLAWTTAVGLTSSEGDFPYTDDGRTPGDPSDDVERLRSNGDVVAGHALAHLRARVGDAHVEGLLLGASRRGGLPGPASQPTRDVRRRETHLMASIAADWLEGGRPPERADEASFRAQASFSAGYLRRDVSDSLGEIGLVPRETADGSFRTATRLALAGQPTDGLEITATALHIHEQIAPEDRLAVVPNAASRRDRGLFGLEARLFGRLEGVRLEARPSARFELASSRLSELRPERAGESAAGGVAVPSFRLGLAAELTPGVAVVGSASSQRRLPSMIELFGDRGFLRGDTRLRPELAESLDLGVVLAGRVDDLAGHLEVRGFATQIADLIRYRQTAQFQATPENVGSASLLGLELGLRGQVSTHLELVGALTLLSAEDHDRERLLPLRPWLSAYARLTGALPQFPVLGRTRLFVELRALSSSFADAANLVELPARAQLGLGLSQSLFEGELDLDLLVRDVFDQRGVDLLGFPLPGRSFALALTGRVD